MLKSVPSGIKNLANLESFGLSKLNDSDFLPYLSATPCSVSKMLLYLSHLIMLVIGFTGSNLLESLPSQIGNLLNLLELTMDNNRLTSVPTGIGNLSNLQELDLRKMNVLNII